MEADALSNAVVVVLTAIIALLVYWILCRLTHKCVRTDDCDTSTVPIAKAAASTVPIAKDVSSAVPIAKDASNTVPDELDAREVEMLARLASRKRNRQRLFAVASAIRDACNLSGAAVVDKEDALIMREFNDQLRHMKVPSCTPTAKPIAISGSPEMQIPTVRLTRFAIISLGNMDDAPVITERNAPGQERPRKMMAGPVQIHVPLPNPATDVQCGFVPGGFDLMVTEAGGQRRNLKVNNMEKEINPVTSSWSLSANKMKVKLLLHKMDPTLIWYSFQADMHRPTQEAIKNATKKLDTDPMGAMAQVLDGFCSALPKPSSREAEENTARGLHQRLMMGIDAALEKTHQDIAKLAQNENVM